MGRGAFVGQKVEFESERGSSAPRPRVRATRGWRLGPRPAAMTQRGSVSAEIESTAGSCEGRRRLPTEMWLPHLNVTPE